MYYDLSVTPIRGNDTFKAEAAMKIQDVFVVQQMHVIQGWNGKTFVGMPQRENSLPEIRILKTKERQILLALIIQIFRHLQIKSSFGRLFQRDTFGTEDRWLPYGNGKCKNRI